MNLILNKDDVKLLEQGELCIFAIPAGKEEISVGQVVGMKEPFKKITCSTGDDSTPLLGVMYRSDEVSVWENSSPSDDDGIEIAPRWSSARFLPEYAIRHHRKITSVETKPLSAVSEDEIKAFHLFYNDPQLLLEGFLEIKNHERMCRWWKQHYPKSMKMCDDPVITVLYLSPA